LFWLKTGRLKRNDFFMAPGPALIDFTIAKPGAIRLNTPDYRVITSTGPGIWGRIGSVTSVTVEVEGGEIDGWLQARLHRHQSLLYSTCSEGCTCTAPVAC